MLRFLMLYLAFFSAIGCKTVNMNDREFESALQSAGTGFENDETRLTIDQSNHNKKTYMKWMGDISKRYAPVVKTNGASTSFLALIYSVNEHVVKIYRQLDRNVLKCYDVQNSLHRQSQAIAAAASGETFGITSKELEDYRFYIDHLSQKFKCIQKMESYQNGGSGSSGTGLKGLDTSKPF